MNEVVRFQEPRLPFHAAITDRFGVEASGWKALVEAVWPSARTVDSVVMALSYCKARKLDPFKKPVHIVPMWDSKSGGYIETVWPGIAELRTTAFRTGQYAGCDEAEFGPVVERTFTGRVKRDGAWKDATVTVEFPEWCRMTVYRHLSGRVCKFVGPKVRWISSYATIGASDLPNDMWETRAEEQLEKCAEAAALRRAFPEEIGNELTAEEMAGRRVFDEPRDVTPAPAAIAPPPPPPPPAPPVAKAPEVEPEIPDYLKRSPQRPIEPPAAVAEPDNEARTLFFESLESALASAESAEDVAEVWDAESVETICADPDDLHVAQAIRDKRLREIGGRR